jgi:hypothetical protein
VIMPQSTNGHGTGTRSERRADDDEPRDPELARVEADIQRSREQVADSMLALRREIARRTDWRGWVSKRPLAFLGGAVALGFLVGFRGAANSLNRR